MAEISEFDKTHAPSIRDHIDYFIQNKAAFLSTKTGALLEIGPQERLQVPALFHNFDYSSLDIIDKYQPTYVGDITKYNSCFTDNQFDVILCMEVLEHTLNPFDAIKELRRILKDGGYLLLSTPLNHRIHGPIPDCWRFTEHAYKSLLRNFDILEIDILETKDRDLFPLHYNVLAKNNLSKDVKDSEINFRFID
jgi:SAM-dependent methyltransferase